MSTSFAKLTGAEFDTMVDRGAFDCIEGKKVELIRGELRFMNPAGPIHDDYIDFLTRWSHDSTSQETANIRVQCGFVCEDNRPEPDILWLQPRRYGRTRPTAKDVMLLIEVSDSSLSSDLQEKADIYAEAGIQEYWVVDIPSSRIHVLSNSDGKSYRKIEIAVSPRLASFRPHASQVPCLICQSYSPLMVDGERSLAAVALLRSRLNISLKDSSCDFRPTLNPFGNIPFCKSV